MSEFKFACPVCGQHITCDSAISGSPMECPTCFRKLVVPQAPKDGSSKLLLTATEVDQRPRPTLQPEAQSRGPAKRFPVGVVLLLLTVLAAAAAVVFYRDDVLKWVAQAPTELPPTTSTRTPARSTPDSSWTLDLAGKKTPDTLVAGRVDGKPFALTRATVQGGTVNLRQGAKWPPDLGVTIHLFAKQGEELAGKTVNINPTWTNAPKLTVRSKGETNQPVNRMIHEGYALRIEFGAVQNGQLPGKIYLSLPDEAHSWVAGNFSAEIRKPQATAAKQ